MIQIIGDGKILGVPYLPVVDGKKREKFNSDNPNWQPEWDFKEHLTPDNREDIPFPIDQMPDFSRDEPDKRGGRSRGGSGSSGKPNASTDPILRRGGRPDLTPTVADVVGVPDWAETVWDQFVNTPGAIGGIDKAIPFEPEGSTKQPPAPSGTRGPQHNECSRGKLPHWRYGGNHSPESKLVQFRVWLQTQHSPMRARTTEVDDGVEHVYFQNGVSPNVRYLISVASPQMRTDVMPSDGVYQWRRKLTYGIKVGYPWMRADDSYYEEITLMFMPKRRVKVRYSHWDVMWPLPDTPRSMSGTLSWYSNRPIYKAAIDCAMGFGSAPSTSRRNYHPPGKPYKRNDEMGCQWQKDEVDYALPELKIGESKIGGNSIKIDDGLIPLANFLVKSIEMMHKGIGLDLLETEFPVSVMKQNGERIKPSSLAQLTQWQFDNVSSLVGLPVENTITTLDDKTEDLSFKNIQDCLSYLVHHQRESDLDLKVIEGYAARTAQQLEAVTQICLRQESDIEMLVKEAGFRWKWETKSRPGLYNIGMKDDDKITGILELFKGTQVSYPVRIWADKLDARQIAMTTNLYAELGSKASFVTLNSGDNIPGLDARIRMNKNSDEYWKEWVKTVNEPEIGVLSGAPIPYIEGYETASLKSKKIDKPANGLSLFMKPKKAKADYKVDKKDTPKYT